MDTEIKIQLTNGDQLRLVTIREFAGLISSQLNQESYRITSSQYEENQYIKIAEACSILHISKPTINSWVDKGVLSRIKIQSRVFFDRSEIMSLLENKKV